MTLKQQPACPKQFNSGFIDLQTHKGHIFTQMNWSWTALPLHCAQRDPSHKVSLLSVRVTWITSQNKKIKATFHFRKCLSVRPGSLSSSLDFHEYICMNLLLIFILKKKKTTQHNNKPQSLLLQIFLCFWRFFQGTFSHLWDSTYSISAKNSGQLAWKLEAFLLVDTHLRVPYITVAFHKCSCEKPCSFPAWREGALRHWL